MSGLHDWFQTPPGQLVLEWERAQFARDLPDVFGYHALQLGARDLDALACNRISHRWKATTELPFPLPVEAPAPDATPLALATDSRALPFPEASLDLVVLPHALELSADPHATLREVHRVLLHEGLVVITGFNPFSLWAARQWRARLWRRIGGGRRYLPERAASISPRRLRDWLRLLDFEVRLTRFGVYQPAVRSERAMARFAWLERIGGRWWPVLGSVYCVIAVKRSPGVRLIGQTWQKKAAVGAAPASVAQRGRSLVTHTKTEP